MKFWGCVRDAMRVDGWNREWMMGKSCSDFFPGSEGIGGHLFFLQASVAYFRFRDGNVPVAVLGADCSGGKMIRGLLGVVVVVGFFDQTFGFQVLEYLSFGGSMYVMVFWVCYSKNNTTWVVGWLVLRLCWCWMVV